MFNKILVVLAVLAISASAEAGPFGLVGRSKYSNNSNTTATTTYNRPVAQVFLGSAQGAANYLASLGRIGHYGNPTGGYEGVGMGGSPQAAIQNCCYYGRRPLRDSGVAQGSNGMWYACCRYN
jgi:hypothetical protein